MRSATRTRLFAVAFGAVGIATAALMLWIMGAFRLSLLRNLVQISPTVPFGASMVLVFAWVLGGPFGIRIARGSHWTAVWLGVILSLSCLMLAAITGAVVYLVTEWKRYGSNDLFEVLVWGPLGIGLYGLLPASVLGVGYGIFVRRLAVPPRSRLTTR
jgi:hypothetical protein